MLLTMNAHCIGTGAQLWNLIEQTANRLSRVYNVRN